MSVSSRYLPKWFLTIIRTDNRVAGGCKHAGVYKIGLRPCLRFDRQDDKLAPCHTMRGVDRARITARMSAIVLCACPQCLKFVATLTDFRAQVALISRLTAHFSQAEVQEYLALAAASIQEQANKQ